MINNVLPPFFTVHSVHATTNIIWLLNTVQVQLYKKNIVQLTKSLHELRHLLTECQQAQVTLHKLLMNQTSYFHMPRTSNVIKIHCWHTNTLQIIYTFMTSKFCQLQSYHLKLNAFTHMHSGLLTLAKSGMSPLSIPTFWAQHNRNTSTCYLWRGLYNITKFLIYISVEERRMHKMN